MPLHLAQRVQVDVSGLQRAVVSVISGPRWVEGVVSDVDEANRRVTVLLEYPVDGKKTLRVAPARIRSE